MKAIYASLILLLAAAAGAQNIRTARGNTGLKKINAANLNVLAAMIDRTEYENFMHGKDIEEIETELKQLRANETEANKKKIARLERKRASISEKVEKQFAQRENQVRGYAKEFANNPNTSTYRQLKSQVEENMAFALEYEDKVIARMNKEFKDAGNELKRNTKLTAEEKSALEKKTDELKNILDARQERRKKWQEVANNLEREFPNLVNRLKEAKQGVIK